MNKKYDIVIKLRNNKENIREFGYDDKYYIVTSVPNRLLRGWHNYMRGDQIHARCFSNNQHGKFLNGWRVKVKRESR